MRAFMELVERNQQRAQEQALARKKRNGKILKWAIAGATLVLAAKAKNTMEIKIKN